MIVTVVMNSRNAKRGRSAQLFKPLLSRHLTLFSIYVFSISVTNICTKIFFCCESKSTTETLELSLSANPLLISSKILPSHLTKFDQFPVYLIQTFGVNWHQTSVSQSFISKRSPRTGLSMSQCHVLVGSCLERFLQRDFLIDAKKQYSQGKVNLPSAEVGFVSDDESEDDDRRETCSKVSRVKHAFGRAASRPGCLFISYFKAFFTISSSSSCPKRPFFGSFSFTHGSFPASQAFFRSMLCSIGNLHNDRRPRSQTCFLMISKLQVLHLEGPTWRAACDLRSVICFTSVWHD